MPKELGIFKKLDQVNFRPVRCNEFKIIIAKITSYNSFIPLTFASAVTHARKQLLLYIASYDSFNLSRWSKS